MTAALLDVPATPLARDADELFTSVYNRWFRRVRQWTRSLATHSCDPDDVAQNVFIVVYRRLPHFDGKNLAGWLYRITANQVRDHQRMAWNRGRASGLDGVADELPSPAPTPAMLLETREQLEAASDVFARLGEGARSSFVLFEVAGYTSKEIAAMQRISVNTVYCRVRRTRKIVLANMARWDDPAGSRPRGKRAARAAVG